MSRIPPDVVNAVRERTDIVEVVGRHVKLIRRGQNYVGLCPFHQEKTPSFNVVPQKGIYHCFGCQSGGDAFRFVMLVENLSFAEAVKELAKAAGVVVPERDLTPDEQRAIRARASMQELLEESASWFESQLWTTNEGQKARDYLAKRGLSEEMARAARVGFAPPGWTHLVDQARRKGWTGIQLVQAGLAREGKIEGQPYDTFRDRLLFPIRNEKSKVVGFGGRLFEGDGPKYINTPETALYEKSKVLYGLDMARLAIQQRDEVLMVEGYFDVLAMHQAGFPNAVATCGTAVTAHHLEKLRRLAHNIVVLTDADEAGQNAAERSLGMFEQAGLEAWRLQLGDAKDPDELLQKAGPDAMTEALKAREPLLDWIVRRKLSRKTREQALNELLPVLVELSATRLSSVAGLLGLNEAGIIERVDRARKSATRRVEVSEPAPDPAPDSFRPTKDQVHLLWLAVHRLDEVNAAMLRVDPSWFGASDRDEQLFRRTLARLLVGEPVAAVAADEPDPGMQRTLLAIGARQDLYGPSHAAQALRDILGRVATAHLQLHLDALSSQIDRHARESRADLLSRATRERAELVRKKSALAGALKTGNAEIWLSLLGRPKTEALPSAS